MDRITYDRKANQIRNADLPLAERYRMMQALTSVWMKECNQQALDNTNKLFRMMP